MDAIELLVRQIELVWTGTLCAGPEFLHDRFKIMRSPAEIGDLVLAGAVGRNVPPGDRLGWLVEIEDEPLGPDYAEGAARRYWHIDRMDGSGRIRWTNVSIIRVIEDTLDEHYAHKPKPIKRQSVPA